MNKARFGPLMASLFLTCVAASDLVMYWGTNSSGTQLPLRDYCSQTPGSIYVISFLDDFGIAPLHMDLSDSCKTTFPNSELLHCPSVGEDIKACQAMGKKILISLGGWIGNYGFNSDSQAVSFAHELWDTFGGGSTEERPFNDAVLDGFDLDAEHNNSTGYRALVDELRNLYESDPSKQYYVSASPMCPYPDPSVGDALAHSYIDFAFIQFYNNNCSLTQGEFNWNQWLNFASNVSPNPDIKIFMGLPGSETAAEWGYIPDVGLIEVEVEALSKSPNFGGISIWDSSQAFSNIVDGQSYAQWMQEILDKNPAPYYPHPPHHRHHDPAPVPEDCFDR